MAQNPRGIAYLAAPYSHPDPQVRKARYESATATAAKLARRGVIVFSPLTLTHPMDVLLADEGQTLGSDYWVGYDAAFMEICSEIIVLRLDGWEKSKGVSSELAFFRQRGRPITFMDPIEHNELEVADATYC